jgi:hypothetical protein
MLERLVFMKYILMLSLTFIFTYSVSVFAVSMQDSNKSVRKVDAASFSAGRLQQKILLSDEQELKVKAILSEYLKSSSSGAGDVNVISAKVESLLDQKQKAKFDIIKNEWWNSFLKEIKKLPAK